MACVLGLLCCLCRYTTIWVVKPQHCQRKEECMDLFYKAMLVVAGLTLLAGLINLVRALRRGNQDWAARCFYISLGAALVSLSLWLPYHAHPAYLPRPDWRFLWPGLVVLSVPDMLYWLRRLGHKRPAA